jgi:23S rRNA (uracil1939-C5)-methyltransferase
MLTFTALVRDLSHKGLGVVDHPDGRRFFVRGTWPGDEGVFEISQDADNYSEAKLKTLVSSSKDRVEIPCSHRGSEPGKCGGCPWMIASYDSQLEFKVKRLVHALGKRKVSVENLKPILPSPQALGYRNRVQLKTDGEKLGYVSEGTSTIAPVDDCLIMNERVRNLFHQLKNSLPREEFRPSGNHHWCFIDLDDELKLEEVVVNKRRPFRQGNSFQNERMKEWVREKFDSLPRHYPIIDLFCGSGNFTEILSLMGFQNILAVEVQGSALKSLEEKKLPGVRILPLDMNSKGSWAQVAKHQPHAKAILIDPPREGIEKRRGLFKYLDNLERIFYVSCELDTYARDTADLIKNKWELIELTPLDLFPHTPHVEILSTFQKVPYTFSPRVSV